MLSLEKDYNYIHPNFRGINNTKDACCSELVISDIDASIDFALENANVDPRLFLQIPSARGFKVYCIDDNKWLLSLETIESSSLVSIAGGK